MSRQADRQPVRGRIRAPARAAHRFRRDCLTQGGPEPARYSELGLHKPGQPPPPRLCRSGACVHGNAPDPGCSRLITGAPVTRVWSNILTLPREDGCGQSRADPLTCWRVPHRHSPANAPDDRTEAVRTDRKPGGSGVSPNASATPGSSPPTAIPGIQESRIASTLLGQRCLAAQNVVFRAPKPIAQQRR